MENKDLDTNLQKKKIIDTIIFFIYVAIVFIGVSFHESWRDEAQQWFLVKDLNFRRTNSTFKI